MKQNLASLQTQKNYNLKTISKNSVQHIKYLLRKIMNVQLLWIITRFGI